MAEHDVDTHWLNKTPNEAFECAMRSAELWLLLGEWAKEHPTVSVSDAIRAVTKKHEEARSRG